MCIKQLGKYKQITDVATQSKEVRERETISQVRNEVVLLQEV